MPLPGSGTVPSIPGPDPRGHLARSVGEANAQDMAWGLGEIRDGARAGKDRAVWAMVNVSAGAGTYDILHALEAKPVGVELFKIVYPKAAATVPKVQMEEVRPEEWTETVAKVHISVVAGVLTDCTAVFLVKGA